jgi:hypothetical protein
MNPFSLFADWAALGAHSAPSLPALDSLPWLRHAAWSLVLAAVVVLLGARRRGAGAETGTGTGTGARTGWLAVLVAAWAWVPGEWGLAYWLGLAFQIPSVLSCVLALWVLARAYALRARPVPEARGALGHGVADGRQDGLRAWAAVYVGAGVLLGWILLFDTFALLPVPVYAWGFGSAAFLLVCALALLPWVMAGAGAWRASGVWQVGVAVALFGVSRWPSGNVWDAVLDPWLWLVLNVYALRTAVRSWRSRP